VKIAIPTVNATTGCFAENQHQVEEALSLVSSTFDSTSCIALHPYTLSGCNPFNEIAHPQFQQALQQSMLALAKGQPAAIFSLYWHIDAWQLWVMNNENSALISFGSAGYAVLDGLAVITDQALIKADKTQLTKLKIETWLVFVLDAYSAEGVAGLHQQCQELSLSGCTVVIVGALGATNDLLLSGDVGLITASRSNYRFALENQCQLVDTSSKRPSIDWQEGKLQLDLASPLIERHYQLVVFALRDFVQKSGFSKVHLGLSGGVDSALVVALAVAALGAQQVVGILMPSEYSSDHSVVDAVNLAKNLGIAYQTIPIKEMHQQLNGFLTQHFVLSGLADENLQARLRGIYLMTYANSTGSFLLTTGNKSEVACGYGTLYGDMCGSYNPIGDLYKTQVYQMCAYINQVAGYGLIPEHILTKAPSAELREGQFDQQSLPEYERLDRIIECLLANQYSQEQVVKQTQTSLAEVQKVANLLRKSEFKRFQSAPVLKLSNTHLGSSRCAVLLSTFMG
jgi:NAD+ synthetase